MLSHCWEVIIPRELKLNKYTFKQELKWEAFPRFYSDFHIWKKKLYIITHHSIKINNLFNPSLSKRLTDRSPWLPGDHLCLAPDYTEHFAWFPSLSVFWLYYWRPLLISPCLWLLHIAPQIWSLILLWHCL